MIYKYLFEIETTDHRFVMKLAHGHDSDAARIQAISGSSLLRITSLVACSKDAPEFGDICRRELVG